MSRFNLIDEKWIPVRYPDGGREELGIRDTLLRAKEIAVIEDPSPLVVAALHRFLLAVLYRALEGPMDIDQAKALFRTGIPGEKVDTYLERWRSRFWLFDERYPFGQNPHVPKDEIEPWTKLTAEYNATTNKVLFDHVNTKNLGVCSPSECARWLVSTMNFSLSGGRGYRPSPSANAMMCIPVGRNLHETLCYNLVWQNREVAKSDVPLWEREPASLPLVSPKRRVSGYADIYTWPARMVLLEETETGEVEIVRFIAGYGFDAESSYTDPMHAYRVNATNGRQVVRFQENRGIWRDFDSLLPDADGNAPLTIQHATKLAGKKPELLPRFILVLGLKNTPPNANVDFWRMEQFEFSEKLAGNLKIREDLRQLLDDIADATSKVLYASLWKFYRHSLIREERKSENDLRKEERAAINKMADAAGPLQHFWAILESAFHEVLHEYTLGRDPDDIRCQWLIGVRNTLRAAWAQHKSSVSTGDAWAIRALVKAEGPIGRKLKELNDEILKYQPREGTS